jgi:hypothetical protein
VDAITQKIPSPRKPLHVKLGDALELVGVDLPDKVRPGTDLEITWYFRATGKVQGDWRMFVHLENPGARFLGDHDPVDGMLPFREFCPDRYVIDRQRIRVPSQVRSGEVAIFAGLFAGGQRLAARGPVPIVDNRIQIGSVPVGP